MFSLVAPGIHLQYRRMLHIWCSSRVSKETCWLCSTEDRTAVPIDELRCAPGTIAYTASPLVGGRRMSSGNILAASFWGPEQSGTVSYLVVHMQHAVTACLLKHHRLSLSPQSSLWRLCLFFADQRVRPRPNPHTGWSGNSIFCPFRYFPGSITAISSLIPRDLIFSTTSTFGLL